MNISQKTDNTLKLSLCNIRVFMLVHLTPRVNTGSFADSGFHEFQKNPCFHALPALLSNTKAPKAPLHIFLQRARYGVLEVFAHVFVLLECKLNHHKHHKILYSQFVINNININNSQFLLININISNMNLKDFPPRCIPCSFTINFIINSQLVLINININNINLKDLPPRCIPCAFIPFCSSRLNVTEHYCPNCDILLGKYKGWKGRAAP
jgi:hypothetical protein